MLDKECSRESFQRMNRPITPNGRLVNKTRQAMREAAFPAPGRNLPAAQRTAMILALAGCTAILIGFLPYVAQRTLTPQPEDPGGLPGIIIPGTTIDSASVDSAVQPVEHSFTLNLHMAEGENGQQSNSTKGEAIRPGAAFHFGKWRMVRSQKVYTNPEGGKYYGLEATGYSPFLTIDGGNIATVTTRCSRGGFMTCETESSAQYREENGLKPFHPLFEFTAPASEENFPEYWRSPAAASWREKAEQLHPDMRNGENLTFQFKNETADSVTVIVGIHWSTPLPGWTIDYARDGKILKMEWNLGPEVFSEFTRYPAIPYEEIEPEVVTITVTFTDGSVQEQKLRLGFDSEGYVVAVLEK